MIQGNIQHPHLSAFTLYLLTIYWLHSQIDTHCLSAGTLRNSLTVLGSFLYLLDPFELLFFLLLWSQTLRLTVYFGIPLVGKESQALCPLLFFFSFIHCIPLFFSPLQGRVGICQRLVHSPVTQRFVLIKDKVFDRIASGTYRVGLTRSRKKRGTLCACVFNAGSHPRSLIC